MVFELDLLLCVPLLGNLLFYWFSKHCSNSTLMVASLVAAVCLLLFLGSLIRITLNVSMRPVRPRLRDFNFPNILLCLLLASMVLPPDTFWYAYLMILVGSSQWSRRLLAVLSGYLVSIHSYLAALVTGIETHQAELSIGGQGPLVLLNGTENYQTQLSSGGQGPPPILVTGTENHQIEISIGGEGPPLALVTGTENHQTEQSIGGQGPLLQFQFNEDDDEVFDIHFGHE